MAAKPTPKKLQARSRGSIAERGKDTYLVRVYIGKDAGSGKRAYHNETVKGTRKDAEKVLTRVLREQDTGAYIAPTGDTLNSFTPLWLRSKLGIQARTRRCYESHMNTRVLPYIGEKKIKDLRKLDVERVIAELVTRGLSPRTIRLTVRVLSSALESAKQSGLLLSNPCEYAELPKVPRGSTAKVWTPDQVATFLKACQGHPLNALYVLLVTAGLRPSEAGALRWTDYDGTHLTIARSLEDDPNGKGQARWIVSDTKTSSSVRRVSLFDITRAALDEHRRAQKRLAFAGKLKNPDGLIFPSPSDGFIGVRLIRDTFYRIVAGTGLPTIRLYDLRHTHATHMLLAKAHPKVVSERLGHSTIQLTLDTYTHLSAGLQEEAVKEAEQRLSYAI